MFALVEGGSSAEVEAWARRRLGVVDELGPTRVSDGGVRLFAGEAARGRLVQELALAILPITILHVSDSHIGPSDTAPSGRVRSAWVRCLARLRRRYGSFDLLIHSGDLAKYFLYPTFRFGGSMLAEVCDIVGLKRKDVLIVPGNHDYWTVPFVKNGSRGRRKAMVANVAAGLGVETIKSFREVRVGPGAIFLGLDTCSGSHLAGGRYDAEDLVEVQQRLERIRADSLSDARHPSSSWKVVVQHHPFTPARGVGWRAALRAVWDEGWMALPVSDEIKGFFSEVDLVLHGHYHKQRSKLSIESVDGRIQNGIVEFGRELNWPVLEVGSGPTYIDVSRGRSAFSVVRLFPRRADIESWSFQRSRNSARFVMETPISLSRGLLI